MGEEGNKETPEEEKKETPEAKPEEKKEGKSKKIMTVNRGLMRKKQANKKK